MKKYSILIVVAAVLFSGCPAYNDMDPVLTQALWESHPTLEGPCPAVIPDAILEMMWNLHWDGDEVLGKIQRLDNIWKVPYLRHVYIPGNEVSTLAPFLAMDDTGFPIMRVLSVLYLGENDISDLSPLNRSPSLFHLEVQGNPVTELPTFEEVRSITYLDLSDTLITDFGILEDYEWNKWEQHHVIVLDSYDHNRGMGTYDRTMACAVFDRLENRADENWLIEENICP